ncbi:MAG: hypothetical protein NTX53_09705 [candidate division WOR-3 bacterium]|nr:hypothetical protein [candidate division WOR-3 bacterium]
MAPTADQERLDRKYERVNQMLAKLLGAVSRKPMALSDALVYELYGLTEEEIGIAKGEEG